MLPAIWILNYMTTKRITKLNIVTLDCKKWQFDSMPRLQASKSSPRLQTVLKHCQTCISPTKSDRTSMFFPFELEVKARFVNSQVCAKDRIVQVWTWHICLAWIELFGTLSWLKESGLHHAEKRSNAGCYPVSVLSLASKSLCVCVSLSCMMQGCEWIMCYINPCWRLTWVPRL